LKTIAQEAGVSIDALLLASISKEYAQHLKRGKESPVSQVVFGIYLANRAPFGEDLSKLAAPTLNLLPLCVRDPQGRSLIDIAQSIQRDIQEISSAEMTSASLADIYEWCGVRVDFFVNVLKVIPSEAADEDTQKNNRVRCEKTLILESKQDLSKRAEEVEVEVNETMETAAKHKAYMVRLSQFF
jgi:hypothetical protein